MTFDERMQHGERKHIGLVGEALRALPFPSVELRVPTFRLEVHWARAALVGYARSTLVAANPRHR